MDQSYVFTLLEQILKISQTGRNYNNTPYDRERYERLIQLTHQLYQLLTNVSSAALHVLEQETGYLTPKVGVNALMVNAAGEVLFEKRADDHCWGLPGGWAEVGLSAEENIRKEVREETGLDVAVTEIAGCFSRLPDQATMHTSYHLLFRCAVTGGHLGISHESMQLAWRYPSSVENWHKDHGKWLQSLSGIWR